MHGTSGCTAPGALSPVYEYGHDATHCSISGGFVARDPTVPTLAGRYLFADYCGTGASALLLPVGATPDIALLGAAPQLAGFGEDSDGHLYITSLKGGVWRVTGTGAADKPPVASFTLSSMTPAVGANSIWTPRPRPIPTARSTATPGTPTATASRTQRA